MDTTLKSLATYFSFIDYRNIKADDVARQLAMNSATIRHAQYVQDRIHRHIDESNGKLNPKIEGENSAEDFWQQANDARYNNKTLHDQIQYSTVNLSLYQNPSIIRELLPNDKNIDAYKPSFSSQLSESLQNGWHLLQSILLFLAKSWSVILLILLGYLGVVMGRRLVD